MNLLEFIEAGFNRAFDQLAKNQFESIKMLVTKIQDLSDAVAQTKLEVKNQFDKLNTTIIDLTTQVADLQLKLQQAQQSADTTDVEQDLDTLISDVKTIGK